MNEPSKKIPVSEKYILSLPEASEYFSIGETKLRHLIQDPDLKSCILKNGNKILIKKKRMEKYIDQRNKI